MDPKSKEFKKLQNKWYKKAKDSGFYDLEQDEERLKDWDNYRFHIHFDATRFHAKQEYYRLAEHFLNDYDFKGKKERLIWKFHAEGLSVVNVVAVVIEQGVHTYRREVDETIRRLAKIMVNRCSSKT